MIKSLDDAKKDKKFTFKYKGVKYTLDLYKELSINTNLLNDQEYVIFLL